MKLATTVVLLAALTRPVEAGPYCGFGHAVAPGESTLLPVAPTIAMHVEHGYYDGKRKRRAKPPVFHATIDGKRVKTTTRDVPTADGIIRFIKIRSKQTGKLELWTRDEYSEEVNVMNIYTITSEWTAPTTATAVVTRGRDTRLGPYRHIGHHATVRVDVPAIAFTLRWRRDAKSRWQTETYSAAINDDTVQEPKFGRAPHWGASEAWIGQRMCGMIETVPLPALERGVDVKLSAMLPDGKTVPVSGLDTLQIPPEPKPEPKPEAQQPAQPTQAE